MNFIEYCIATRNYSAINAVKSYADTKKIKESLKKNKNKLIAGAAAATALGATGYAALDKDASRAVRKLTGNSTEYDKLYERLDELDDDKQREAAKRILDDLGDSKVGRMVKESKGDATLRDKYLDLKDKLGIGGNKIDEINEKYGINSPDDHIWNPVKSYQYLHDLDDAYGLDD